VCPRVPSPPQSQRYPFYSYRWRRERGDLPPSEKWRNPVGHFGRGQPLFPKFEPVLFESRNSCSTKNVRLWDGCKKVYASLKSSCLSETKTLSITTCTSWPNFNLFFGFRPTRADPLAATRYPSWRGRVRTGTKPRAMVSTSSMKNPLLQFP